MTEVPAPVRLAGAANFRDFGGWPTREGGCVRRGVLFRSNRLSKLTAADSAILDGLGITTIFDLRARHEREADPTGWRHPALKIRTYSPGHKRSLADMAREYPPDLAGAKRLMSDFYGAMPRALAHAFSAILHDLADGAAPCIIHCSAGKDRTGVAAAFVLAALGVDAALIRQDYALTEQRIRPEDEMARAMSNPRQAGAWGRYPPDAAAVLLGAAAENIDAAFAAIEAEHGSVDAYLSDALKLDGETLLRLRGKLVRPAALLDETDHEDRS